MISKRIDREPQHDNYRALGLYVGGYTEQNPDEKVLYSWHESCLADDYQEALIEIEATQSLNTRATGEKTYHLLLSFRPEDEGKLTPDALKDIERNFAEALNFHEHQRLCGVHKNTGNVHMHIAYNMIHPESFSRHEPFRDFYKLSEACRAMEQKYNLTVDKGITKGQEPTRVNQKVASMEAHSGQQSFQSYAKERQSQILEALTTATSWQDVHATLASYGMAIKTQGRGLSVINLHGKGAIKASELDRSLSKKRLEDRFGDFTAASLNIAHPKEQYTAKPLQKAANRDKLYEDFQSRMEERSTSLALARTQRLKVFDSIKEKWAEKYKEFDKRILPRRTKTKLLQILRQQEQDEREKARTTYHAGIQEIKDKHPYHNWNSYLKWQAGQGNEMALAVLRSRAQEFAPEKPQKQSAYEAKQDILDASKDNKKAIQESSLRYKSKRALLAINLMEQLAALETAQQNSNPSAKIPVIFSGATHTIDNKGVVLFTLASGGLIRDTGNELHFSAHDKTAQEAALLYAQSKWGKRIKIEGNKVEREVSRQRTGITR